jgi:hypothetical protein
MSEHVAKRTPRCSECRRTITNGEMYHRETGGAWHGMPIVRSFCGQCCDERQPGNGKEIV